MPSKEALSRGRVGQSSEVQKFIMVRSSYWLEIVSAKSGKNLRQNAFKVSRVEIPIGWSGKRSKRPGVEGASG